jgi:hypothetical protein
VLVPFAAGNFLYVAIALLVPLVRRERPACAGGAGRSSGSAWW